jgi:hypothetical protein
MTRALLALVALASTARAAPRDAPTELEVDRNDAPLGRVELGFDSGAPLPAWGIGANAGWLEEPLVFTLPEGTVIQPVRRRQTLAIGGALAINSIVLDARLAGSHQIGDRLGDGRALDRWVGHDFRIGARIRVTGDDRNAAFVRADLTLPSGDSGDFAGEPSWTLAWRLIGRLTFAHDIVVAGTLGLRLRGEEVIVADRLVGNEVLGALGVVLPVHHRVKLTVEVAGAIGDSVGQSRGPSPAEARAGVIVTPTPQLTLGVRGGVGITDEIGSPALRVLLEAAWQP